MISLTRRISLLLLITVSAFAENVKAQSVLNPADPVVNYDPANPPTQPAYGQIGKWVRTKRPEVWWSTDEWKAYIYKGKAFRLKYPKTYVPGVSDGKTYPIMLFFHGLGEADTVTDNEWHLLLGTRFFEQSVNNGTYDGYILAMQSPAFFGPGDYLNLFEIIEYMRVNNKVDPFAVTANGLSSGGQATWEITNLHPDVITTAVPMSWASILFKDPAYIDKIKFRPMWGSQGHLDGNPALSTGLQVRDALLERGANFKLTEYPFQDHATWDQVWSDPGFWDFIKGGYASNPWSLYGKFEFGPGEPVNATIGLPLGFEAYEWRKNGVLIPGATSNTINVTELGTYDARVKKNGRWSEWSRRPVVLKAKTFINIPAKIEAENWSYRQNVYTETTVDAGGGQNIGWFDYADWVDYNINVPTAGNYTLKLRAATYSFIENKLQVKKSDGTVLSTVNIPHTGGWQSWYTVTTIVNLPAGPQTIRLYNAWGGYNLNWLEFSNGGAGNAAPTANAGQDQMITLPTTTAQLSGSGTDSDGSVSLYSWTRVSGPTGAKFNNLNSATPIVSDLVAGTYVFRLVVTDNSGASTSDDVTVTVIQATNPSSNIHIEAEFWSAQTGVQTETTTDAGGGLNVGYIDYNDWMEYIINPDQAGTYTFKARIASGNTSGGQFQVRKTDGTVLGTFNVPNTGGWQSWQTLTGTVTLAAGQQTVRLVSTGGNWNINWLEFVRSGTSSNLPPVANAGADQSISLPTNSVQLNGSGTDNDGTITGYSWTKVSGPASGTFSSTSVANPTVNNLEAGTYTFRLQVTDNGGAIGVDDVIVIVNSAPSSSARIEAENYIAMSGVQTETTSDPLGGARNVGWIDINDWMDYNINVSSAGTYTFKFRIASQMNGAQFQVKKGSAVLATVNVPNTGGWQSWVTVQANVDLTSGAHTIRLQSVNSASWNINWLEYSFGVVAPTYTAIPAKIEAENWTNMNGVQTEGTADAGGGLNVGYIDPGDWMDYNINAPSARTYTFSIRLATPQSGGKLEVRAANGSVLATVNVPVTGGWQTWQTATASVSLPSGNQTIRIISTGTSYWNINWINITTPTAGGLSRPDVTVLEASTLRDAAPVEIFPNPVQDRFTVRLNSAYSGRLRVQILNLTGSVVREFSLNKTAGSFQSNLSAGNLPRGEYIIRIQSAQGVETRKLIKQ